MDEVERQIFDYSLKLLARRAYSVAEIRRKLIEKGWTDEDAIGKTLEKLTQQELLNDEKFAEEFVASKLRRKPVGKHLLSKNLRERQINEEIIKNALEKIDEKKLIKEAIQKRLRVKGYPKTLKELKNLQDYLIRQGFDFELVYESIRKLSTSFEEFQQ